jgi:hypothetical protein
MVRFPSWTPTTPGEYHLTCQTTWSADQNPDNDLYTTVLTAVIKAPDVWMKDHPDDYRDYPDDNGDVPSDPPYLSPDIWVRNVDDGGLYHEPPQHGQPNYIYVRLRNRGQYTVPWGRVEVFVSKSGLRAPCNDMTSAGGVEFENLAYGEERIVSLEWLPPSMNSVSLIAVINAASDPPGTFHKCHSDWPAYDNNVSWRNTPVYRNSSSVLSSRSPEAWSPDTVVANPYERPKDVDIIVDRLTFPIAGSAIVGLPDDLFDRWLAHGEGWSEGVEVLTLTKEIRLTGAASATIGAIPMFAGEETTATMQFEAPAGQAFELEMRERIDGEIVGGIAYHWLVPDSTPPGVDSTIPAGDASGVAPGAPLAITFDESIGPLSLDLALTPDPGGWFFTWNDDYTVVTATHSLFAVETSYTATVSAGDAWGNPMIAPFTWSFTTGRFRVYLPTILYDD